MPDTMLPQAGTRVVSRDSQRHYYIFSRSNTSAERMTREVVGALEELSLLGHTVALGAMHGAPTIDAKGTCMLTVSVRGYPSWHVAAGPVLDRRGLKLRLKDRGPF